MYSPRLKHVSRNRVGVRFQNEMRDEMKLGLLLNTQE